MWSARVWSISAFLMILSVVSLRAQIPPIPELQRLHDVLNLRLDQDASWQTYARSTEINPQDMARQRDAAQRMVG